MENYPIFSVITILLVIPCTLYGCYKKRNREALSSTPIVVTSQVYQPPRGQGQSQGPYQVSMTTSGSNINQNLHQPPIAMPMPHNTPYPPVSEMAPYSTNTSAPYPPNTSSAPYLPSQYSAPYPTNSSAPYPSNVPYNEQNDLPPSYSQTQGNTFAKQPAYNPTYKS